MINEAETFAYRNRLAPLVKIDPQLVYDMAKTPLVQPPWQRGNFPGKSSLREPRTVALRTILPHAYIAVE